MKVELEIHDIIRRGETPEKKADQICRFANFKKERVIKALNTRNKREMKTVDFFRNIVRLHPENLRRRK